MLNISSSLGHVTSLQSHSACVTVHDPAKVTPSGYNDKQGVSLWTYAGRKALKAES